MLTLFLPLAQVEVWLYVLGVPTHVAVGTSTLQVLRAFFRSSS